MLEGATNQYRILFVDGTSITVSVDGEIAFEGSHYSGPSSEGDPISDVLVRKDQVRAIVQMDHLVEEQTEAAQSAV